MLADYFNNPHMPSIYSGVSEKWYEVARTREKNLFKKVDIFMFLSMTYDNAFDLLYVSVDEINRRLTKCYHGKFVIKRCKNYLIIRQRLWRKRFLIIAQNDDANMVALSNRRKSKVWILTSRMPYEKSDFDKVMKEVENQGFDMNAIELFGV